MTHLCPGEGCTRCEGRVAAAEDARAARSATSTEARMADLAADRYEDWLTGDRS